MAINLTTLEENKEMDSSKILAEACAVAAAAAVNVQSTNSPTHSTHPVPIKTCSIKINDQIGNVQVHIQVSEIRMRSVFIHVDVPGQEDDAKDMEHFPTIQQIGEEVLLKVMDELKIQLCVGIGDGAGANILARFGLAHPERLLGLVLINLVSSGVGFLESIKEKFFSKRRSSQQLCPEEIVTMHKLGNTAGDGLKYLVDNYSDHIKQINSTNLHKFMSAYMNRKEIVDLGNLDILLVTGSKSPFAAGVEHIYTKCDKQKTSLLKVDNCVDVLSQCPEKFAQSLLLFVKGLGFLTSLHLPGITHGGDTPPSKSSLAAIGRRRTLSMEEYVSNSHMD
ncbi:NDRG3-like protein [Euroglyphus maynei]|uniref:NDRG3-like protein n=1 Tax=Euroglyphus maynei TaxID=6958 RepID=A0A1Y3AVJ4_EURMA|nr:NDRG3-like protein [Euroglyphus maynei]